MVSTESFEATGLAVRPLHHQLWAKSLPFRSLRDHCLDVGSVGLELLRSDRFRGVPGRMAAAAGVSVDLIDPWVAYLISLHDVGKAEPNFQSKAPELCQPLQAASIMPPKVLPTGFRHEASSALWVVQHLRDQRGWGKGASEALALCLRGHHGNFDARRRETLATPAEEWREEQQSVSAPWQALRRALADDLWQAFSPSPWQPAAFKDHGCLGMLLSGMLVLADWIASNPSLYPFEVDPADPVHAVTSKRLRARESLSRLGLEQVPHFPAPATFQEIWPGERYRQPRPLQLAVERACQEGAAPGLAILEAPTGEGKTEAAIYLASQWMQSAQASGLYIALPTAATSNQMHRRLRAFIGQLDPAQARQVRLVHGTAWLAEDVTGPILTPPAGQGEGREDDRPDPLEALTWFLSTRRALLAPYAVGTVDQALLAGMNVRFGFLRLLGLAGSVLIVDEVHAYDAYMSHILTRLLHWCGILRIPVILLSATLPRQRKKVLIEAYRGLQGPPRRSSWRNPPATPAPAEEAPESYPLITLAPADPSAPPHHLTGFTCRPRPSVRLVHHEGLLGDAQGIAGQALAAAEQGGCVAVVVNTVGMAQQVFMHLQQRAGSGVELQLLHARFPAARRQEIEAGVLERYGPPDSNAPSRRPAKAIVVATQVIEQSLDLDFDVMLSELCPADLLVQRAGRLHRHQRPATERGGHDNPAFHVFLPASKACRPGAAMGPTERVYDRFILLKTLAALQERSELPQGGDQLRALIEEVYGSSNEPVPGSAIDRAALAEAWEVHQKVERGKQDRASMFLVPPPDAGAFTPVSRARRQPFADHDSELASFAHASTRDSDQETLPVVVLEGDAFAAELADGRFPGLAVVRQILAHGVRLPAWWLAGLKPAEYYQEVTAGPEWLREVRVMRTVGSQWAGVDGGGHRRLIRNEKTLGLLAD